MTDSNESSGKRIVVGLDGSASSITALGWAAGQAALTGASVEVLATWEWPTTYGWAFPYPSDFDPAAETAKTIGDLVEKTQTAHPGVAINWSVVEGHPAPLLVDASEGAELLVVGSRGHGEFAGMLLGSVSEYCAHHGHCPVVILH